MLLVSDDHQWGVAVTATLDPLEPDDVELGIDAVVERLQDGPGEVVLILRAPQEGVWIHTKKFYPQDVFRMPTGSMKDGEEPDEAFRRELLEETGIESADEPERLARIEYRLGEQDFPYVSYLYAVDGVADEPQPTDTTEQITGWELADLSELAVIADDLRDLPDKWNAWGVFRALAHEVLLQIPQ